MAREIVGEITCPHCGQAATVHQNARGAKLMYYRCGVVVRGFSTGCGTAQIYGRSGQQWIAANLRPDETNPKGSHPAAPADAPAPAPVRAEPEPITKPAPAPARKSVLGTLAHLLTEE
jgi:hypothetical protein